MENEISPYMPKRRIKRKMGRKEEKYLAYLVGCNEKKRGQDIDNLIKTISELWQSHSVNDWIVSNAKTMLCQIMDLQTFPRTFSVFIEMNYVDKVYRDIYYHHYASRHFSQPRNCIRLFFFDLSCSDGIPMGLNRQTEEIELPLLEDGNCSHFVGVCVLQPNGIIGRSYWNPHYFLTSGNYVRTSRFSGSVLGKRWTIRAFPYMMQDQEATTCAEVTVLNLIDYYSNSYTEYPCALLSDIELVEARHSADRIFPSRGMSYADVSRSLAQIGLAPIVYASHSSKLTHLFMRRYLYYYVESGIPFGIAVESGERGILHSMICIGHGPMEYNWLEEQTVNYLSKDKYGNDSEEQLHQCWIANSADAYCSFIVMDDNQTPYQTVKLTISHPHQWIYPTTNNNITAYAVDYLCVPLYKRVFLSADGAEELFCSILTSRMGFQAIVYKQNIEDLYHTIGSEQNNPLIIRIFLASSRTFFAERISMFHNISETEMDRHFETVYQNLYCPRFIWVCELYSKDLFHCTNPQAIGEIVVDATARQTGNTDSLDGVILIHYPHYITYRDTESNWTALNDNGKQLDKWCPFQQFRGNLSS